MFGRENHCRALPDFQIALPFGRWQRDGIAATGVAFEFEGQRDGAVFLKGNRVFFVAFGQGNHDFLRVGGNRLGRVDFGGIAFDPKHEWNSENAVPVLCQRRYGAGIGGGS